MVAGGKIESVGQYTPGVPPPSTAIDVPCMCRAASELKNKVKAATSSGVPNRIRPSRVTCASCSFSTVLPLVADRCSKSRCRRGVSVSPGRMAFTFTPSILPKPDSPLVELLRAAFTAPPIRKPGSGVRAAPPMMLTTWPLAVFRKGQNRRQRVTLPKNLRAKPSCQASCGRSAKAPARVAPAELTRTSQRPWRRDTSIENGFAPVLGTQVGGDDVGTQSACIRDCIGRRV